MTLPNELSRGKAIATGLLAGLVAAIAITVVMLLLACFGVATPLFIIGDRLSVFIPPGPFLSIMGKVGGYNHLKQLGVGSTIVGQLVVGAIAGAIFGFCTRGNPGKPATFATMTVFVALPLIAAAIALAGVWNELRWFAHCCRATGYARRFRVLRFCFRANARLEFSISHGSKN
jgi:hypothetical protein